MGQWQGIAILMAILMILVIIPSTPPEEIENSRFVPDIAIPPHPPCPPGSDCAEVHTCSNEQTPSPFEFETNWTATGSNRMMSSPHAVELTGDGILDIVVGTGIEEEVTGSIIALDGSNGTLLWEISASGEMFASAQFAHLDGDEILDVILGGRNHKRSSFRKKCYLLNQKGNVLGVFLRNRGERVSDSFTKPLLFTLHLRLRKNRGTRSFFTPSRRFLRFLDFLGSGNQKWRETVRGVAKIECPRKTEKCENGR